MITLSPSAIDQASIELIGRWGGSHEGLHSWLTRMVKEALAERLTFSNGALVYDGLRFTLIPMHSRRGYSWLVLSAGKS